MRMHDVSVDSSHGSPPRFRLPRRRTHRGRSGVGGHTAAPRAVTLLAGRAITKPFGGPRLILDGATLAVQPNVRIGGVVGANRSYSAWLEREAVEAV
jgi:hypothetical protein